GALHWRLWTDAAQAPLTITGRGPGRRDVGQLGRCRWRGTDKLPPLGQTVMRDAIEHCQRSYGAPLAGATLTITLGEYALYTMTGIRTLKGRERGEGDTTK